MTDYNKAPIDWYTFSHFGAGIYLGGFLNEWQVLTGAILFEILERPAKEKLNRFFPVKSQDSLINSIVDVGAAFAGAYIMNKSKKHTLNQEEG